MVELSSAAAGVGDERDRPPAPTTKARADEEARLKAVTDKALVASLAQALQAEQEASAASKERVAAAERECLALERAAAVLKEAGLDDDDGKSNIKDNDLSHRETAALLNLHTLSP